MLGKRAHQPGVPDGTSEPETPKKKICTKSTTPRKSKPATPKSTKKPKIATPVKIERTRIIVAIDFGTTFSGVAYVLSTDCDAKDVWVIIEWLDGARINEQLEKVPSRYAFAIENKGVLTEDEWGYGVKPGMKSYGWTKLLLDSDATKTEFDGDALSGEFRRGLFELPPNMTAIDLVAKYLEKLYSHTMDRLSRNYGPSMLKVTPIDFWFTVPAKWQETAKDATIEAANRAGFGTQEGRYEDELNIITEPEAAAIAILSEAIRKKPTLFKINTNILIADLGGGTLDFQCLTIKKLDPLRTEEPIAGNGGKSGSTYIDCNLHSWLTDTFGEAFTSLPSSKTGQGSKFMNEFELVKKTFNGKDMNKTYQIALPALGNVLRDRNLAPSSFDFDDSEIQISARDLAEMFRPVIETACALMKEQLATLKKEKKSAFSVVCLCGGLGQSEYIWQQFEAFCKKKLKGECELVTDERAWSAVVRGAAIRGLDGSMVIAKRAKYCWGIGVHQAFREGIDDEEDAFDCPINGKRANGYIDWTVKRGKRFVANFRAESKLYVAISPDDDPDQLIYSWKLYQCGADEAPVRIEEPEVEEIGRIKLNLSRTWKRQNKNAATSDLAQRADIKIVIKLGNEKGLLMVEALHNRTVVGTAEIEFGRPNVKVDRSAGLL